MPILTRLPLRQLLVQSGFRERLILLRVADSLSGGVQLGVQTLQDIDIPLLVVGQGAQIMTLKVRKLSILFVKLGFGIVELFRRGTASSAPPDVGEAVDSPP